MPRRFPQALLAASLLSVAAAAQTPVDFDRDVRPILADKCFHCHGPDQGQRKAKLRLDTREGATAERKRGHVIVPGDPDRSLLAQRITHRDPEERMPPADSQRALSEQEVQLLIRWIEEGAPWAEHWTFVAPSRPAVPATRPADQAHNEIDAFVLARAEAAGLPVAQEADRAALIRRVTFDLTGLPPTPAEVEAFAADPSPRAYDDLVDRLLASPHYGEHMARYWLDAARYGDTHGLHLDNYREMWPYRDWVIGAFNDNLPFDQFAVEQIAGDLLPDATLDQQIASGFNRCHVTTAEGGAIVEEFYVRNVIDRVSTTGTVFLGLTVGCAVCHDHKFDPLSQKEFYQLFAFFNNLDGKAMDDNAQAPPPVVKVPTAEQTKGLATLRGERAQIEAEIAARLATVDYEEPAAEPEAPATERTATVWVDDAFPAGAVAKGNGLGWVEAPREFVHSGRLAMVRRAKGSEQHFFDQADRKLRIGAGDVLFTWVYLDPADPPREVMLQWNSVGDATDGWRHRAYWGEDLIDHGATGTSQRRRLGDLPEAGQWVKLAVDAASVGLGPGMVVHGQAFTQFDGTVYWDAAGLESAVPQEPEDFAWVDDDVPSGAVLAGDGETWRWVGAGDGPVLNGLRSLRRRGGDRLNQDFFTGAVPVVLQAGDSLFAHVWLDPKDPPRSVQLQWNDGTWEHRARWGAPAHGEGAQGGADHVAGPLPELGTWVRLEVDPAAVGLKPGAAIHGQAFTQVGGTVYWDRAGVRTWGPPDDRYRRSQLAWEQRAVADSSLSEPVVKAAETDAAQRTPEQQRLLRDHYLRHVFAGTRQIFDGLENSITELDQRIEKSDKEIATCLVMVERAEPREAYLLDRGQYDQKREPVGRSTPAFLPPMPEDLPRDRLGFARWLVDPSNPLTARVTVNRLWQQVFGTGLVKTSEDFGTQGERPTHPQLLDWLAVQFVADGWDVKKTMRRLVTSATYRQSSAVPPTHFARDPENRLLARGPRFRLDAEMLRDQALLLSGLLVDEIGGPSVKPPQPEGLWKAVGYVGSNTDTFEADQGPDKIYRRSLYTFWKRTSPPPQMSTFDAPSRESCIVRRERTNTPLQALLLMDDPQYVEAARALAQRALREGGETPEERARWTFRLVTCREPAAADLDDMLALLEQQRHAFAGDPAGAAALIAVGPSKADPELAPVDLAAWTMVANLLLNLDEVQNKG